MVKISKEENVKLITLKVLDNNKNIKFCVSGTVIDTVYECEFSEGDSIRLELANISYLAVKLDEILR